MNGVISNFLRQICKCAGAVLDDTNVQPWPRLSLHLSLFSDALLYGSPARHYESMGVPKGTGSVWLNTLK